jgi:two-component system C4-dicarboxylate transport sensor histidine kinase DctB
MSDSPAPAPRRRPDRGFVLMALAALAFLVLFAVIAFRWSERRALAQADIAAAQAARGQLGLLGSELQKFRLLPLVLTEYPDVHAVLGTHDAVVARRLDGKLEQLSARTDAAVIYVIDRDGRTLAASNWRLPTSFVGQDYGFRPYFQDAMRHGAAELFALGTVSGRPGLYIAQRVEGPDGPLGVIVVKVEFDRVEASWARRDGITYVTDRHGVVIVTSRPDWRFRASRPLSGADRAELRRTLQFGSTPLRPLPLPGDDALIVDSDGAHYRAARLATPLAGADLHYLQPLAAAEAGAAATARAAILTMFVLLVLALAWRYRAHEKRQLQIEAQRALEREVAARTFELSESNRRLTGESEERARADRRYRAAREELAQANRLGSIGQITASVAHEINQPVAAIRTFAENAARFLDREQTEKARANLDSVVGLADRIGAITAELRGFARRGTPAIGAVAIAPMLDGALLLIGDRIRAVGAALERTGASEDIRVVADRVRLEQIVINLMQNALDAIEGHESPRVRIAVADGERVTIEIADNGPGIPPELADSLFTPFVTGKPDGLGLGLGIARDIAREFGGDLEPAPSPLGGGAFRITLRHA